MEKYYHILENVSLFKSIATTDIPKMLNCLDAQTEIYKKNTFIRFEGDKADFIGIVLEGNIQVLQDDYDGNRNITAVLEPGSLFGEAFACAQIPFLPVNILAQTDCVVLNLKIDRILNPTEIHSKCNFQNQLIKNLLKIVAQKNVFLSRKLEIVSHKTTSEKLMAFLNDQAKLNKSMEFNIPYDRQALANFLGVERSAMSAEISKLKKAGVLETNKNHFHLL